MHTGALIIGLVFLAVSLLFGGVAVQEARKRGSEEPAVVAYGFLSLVILGLALACLVIAF